MLPLTALLAACLPALALADVYSLSDLSWTLRNNNGSIVIPAKVPSQAHLDLLAAGIIEEPLLEQNGEFSFHSARAFECRGDGRRRVAEYYDRWIVNDSWTYTAELTPFTQAVPYSAQQKTLLVFYGLDTIANIVRASAFYLLYLILYAQLWADCCRTSRRLGGQPVQAVCVRRHRPDQLALGV